MDNRLSIHTAAASTHIDASDQSPADRRPAIQSDAASSSRAQDVGVRPKTMANHAGFRSFWSDNFRAKNSNKWHLKQMASLPDGWAPRIAEAVIVLSKKAKQLGWEKSFASARTTSMHALRCVSKPAKSLASSKNDKLSVYSKYIARRRDFRPFVFDEKIDLPDDDEPIIGDVNISLDENIYVQEGLLHVLDEFFPKEMEALEKENADARPKGLAVKHYASDYAGWFEDLKARGTLDRIVIDIHSTHLHPENSDLWVKISPEYIIDALNKVQELPEEFIEMPILPFDEERLQNSFKTQGLLILAREIHFESGDFTLAFEKIAEQANDLPAPEERSSVKRALWKTSAWYLETREKKWAQSSTPDEAEFKTSFDCLIDILDGIGELPNPSFFYMEDSPSPSDCEEDPLAQAPVQGFDFEGGLPPPPPPPQQEFEVEEGLPPPQQELNVEQGLPPPPPPPTPPESVLALLRTSPEAPMVVDYRDETASLQSYNRESVDRMIIALARIADSLPEGEKESALDRLGKVQQKLFHE